jgi:hypothetical protein
MDSCQKHAGMTSKEIMAFIKHYRSTSLLITPVTDAEFIARLFLSILLTLLTYIHVGKKRPVETCNR